MTLNELIQGLNKLTQFAGELPVVIKDAETEAETVLHSIGINIDPAGGTANGSISLNHAPAPAAVPAPAPAEPAVPAEVDPAGQPVQ
jgi:hypothetical protein